MRLKVWKRAGIAGFAFLLLFTAGCGAEMKKVKERLRTVQDAISEDKQREEETPSAKPSESSALPSKEPPGREEDSSPYSGEDPSHYNGEEPSLNYGEAGKSDEAKDELPGAAGTPDLENGREAEETAQPVKVRGIYVTGPKAGSDGMRDLIELADTTRINAMVIDVKNDAGEITYEMDSPLIKETKAARNYIRDMEGLIKELKEKDIYLIARIVAFKDPILAEAKQELALKKKNGKIFRDKSGLAWVDPAKKEVWNYLYEAAEQAAKLGFDEIQFDYVRYSTDSLMKDVDFSGQEKTRQQVITGFIKNMTKKLHKLKVFVSADVYGIVINSKLDQDIVGQDYKALAKELDYICPMIYPSHYGDGSFGIAHPDTQPYEVVYGALKDSQTVLQKLTKPAVVRPWLQDFTASWLSSHIKYGKDEIEAQIKAVEDAGYEEWILWNGSNRYTRLD